MKISMEKVMSKKDVIVCRGIWYVMTLLSLFGLSISLNLLWPPGGKTPSRSRFLRDVAVSATTFYAVTLLRCFFFSDPPSPCYKVFTTKKERFPQGSFSYIALYVVLMSPVIHKALTKEFAVPVSLFSISLFTGGIGLIQLSDKLRMEIRHALITLFLGWFLCLSGIFMSRSYGQDTHVMAYGNCLVCQSALATLFFGYTILREDDNVDSDTNSAPPLPV